MRYPKQRRLDLNTQGVAPFAFGFSIGARSVAFKSGAYLCPQEVEQQRAGNGDAYPAFNYAPQEYIHQVAQNLYCNNGYCQSPSPNSPFEPTQAGSAKRGAKQ